MNLRQLPFNQAELAELPEGAANPGEQGSASHRHDQVLGKAPAELLDDLEAKGLGPFRVVAAQVDVGEGPPVPIPDLRAEAIHVVITSVNRDDPRSRDGGPENLARFEGLRNEDVALEPKPRSVRRDAVAKVAS